MMKLHIVLFVSALGLGHTAWAQTATGHGAHHGGHQGASSSPAAAGEKTQGEVRRVDSANKKVTLRHDEIKNLQMPAMTMVFEVKDAAMLADLKQGDTVRFTAEQINGAYTVTSLEVVR